MAKFCWRCGAKLHEATGLCPNCDANKLSSAMEHKQQLDKNIDSGSASESVLSKKVIKRRRKAEKKAVKKAAKKAKKASWSLGKKIRHFLLKFISVILLVVLVAVGSIGSLVYFDMIDVPIVGELLNKLGLKERNRDGSNQDEESINLDNYRVEAPDAEEFFQQNSQILTEIDVNDSKNVLTEAQLINTLEERGFKDYPVTTEYTMDGVYNDAATISDSSSTKHPIYQTNYVTENGEIWTIFVIDGDIMANPVSYNIQSSLGVQVIVSESDAVTSYDSTTNKFYKTVPDKSALIVRVVEKIDAETLEKLTIGVIDE